MTWRLQYLVVQLSPVSHLCIIRLIFEMWEIAMPCPNYDPMQLLICVLSLFINLWLVMIRDIKHDFQMLTIIFPLSAKTKRCCRALGKGGWFGQSEPAIPGSVRSHGRVVKQCLAWSQCSAWLQEDAAGPKYRIPWKCKPGVVLEWQNSEQNPQRQCVWGHGNFTVLLSIKVSSSKASGILFLPYTWILHMWLEENSRNKPDLSFGCDQWRDIYRFEISMGLTLYCPRSSTKYLKLMPCELLQNIVYTVVKSFNVLLFD